MELNNKKNTSTPGERLKYLRALLGLTRPFITKRYKISEITIRSWEKEKLSLTEKALNRCVHFLKAEGMSVSKDWLNYGSPPDPFLINGNDNKIISTIVNNNKSMLEPSVDSDFDILRDARIFNSSYSDAIVLSVGGSEMEPFFHSGDYVGGRLVDVSEPDLFVGKDCIVVLTNGLQLLRRPFKTIDDTFNLSCLNPKLIEPVIYNAKIAKIAPVIWHRKNLRT
jgi:hypothetical protein